MDRMHPSRRFRQARTPEREQHARARRERASTADTAENRRGDVERGRHAQRPVFERQRVERRLVGRQSFHVVETEADDLHIGPEHEEQAGKAHGADQSERNRLARPVGLFRERGGRLESGEGQDGEHHRIADTPPAETGSGRNGAVLSPPSAPTAFRINTPR